MLTDIIKQMWYWMHQCQLPMWYIGSCYWRNSPTLQYITAQSVMMITQHHVHKQYQYHHRTTTKWKAPSD